MMLIDHALTTAFRVLPKLFLMVITVSMTQYQVQNELRKMIVAAIGQVRPILIEPVSFACEGDRCLFEALSCSACDLGERADLRGAPN
jgi:hypothetical protein